MRIGNFKKEGIISRTAVLMLRRSFDRTGSAKRAKQKAFFCQYVDGTKLFFNLKKKLVLPEAFCAALISGCIALHRTRPLTGAL